MKPLRRDRSGGFTLLELLISLTLLSVIMVLVLGAMRLGVRTWERGEAMVEEQQRCRVALDLIRRQLAAIYVPVEGVDRMIPEVIGGDGESIRFLSRASLVPASDAGMIYAEYQVENEDGGTKALSFREKALITVPGQMKNVDAADIPFYKMISAVSDIRFEYLKTPVVPAPDGMSEMADEWQETWSYATDGRAPRAVRITLQAEEGDTPVRMVIPCRRVNVYADNA